MEDDDRPARLRRGSSIKYVSFENHAILRLDLLYARLDES
jgi:hypothetical protein